ncbi:hypothetical protein SEUCBS139899_008078 [Sporothrix eucalyptigena]|uniref:CBM1 domain-containing protein n=1 Tax=Sporothrix eucalyptigena TaxID=1812306 RepID=A0ABP0CGI3_9PEZI
MKTFSTTLVTSLFVASGLCASLAPTQTIYGQCGGKTWDGPTACQTGTVCNPNSEWFYQCLDQAGIAAVQDANNNQNNGNSNNNGNSGNNNNNPPAAPAGPPGGFRGGGGRGPPGGFRGGPPGGRFGPPGGNGGGPPNFTPPPSSGNGNNNGGNGNNNGNGGGNNGGNDGNYGGNDGNGDTVVTRTLSTIYNVGSATITTNIPYLTVAPQ